MAQKHSYRSTQRTRRGAVTTFGSRTDVGCVREQNEDSLVVTPPLFVIADGMGGHEAGEVASEIAVSTIAEHAPQHPDPEALGAAVEEANRAIIDAAMSGEGRQGMGTTCTAAMLENDKLVIAQVGDSRAYLLHDGKLSQITRDHSLMADMIESGQITLDEARVHPNRSVITRALGNDPATRPDLYEMTVMAGDRLLLCSDGLTSMIIDDDIEAVLKRVKDPQRCAAQLVNEAIAAGGYDNITVIVSDIQGTSVKQHKKVKRRSRAMVVFIILLFLAIIGGSAWGTMQYLNHVAYLGNNDGYVAIYQGVPGEVLGLSSSTLIETTEIAVADLSSTAGSSINEGLRVGSVEEAQALVEQYRSDLATRGTGATPTATAPLANSTSSTSAGSASTASGNAGTSANATSTSASDSNSQSNGGRA